MLARLGQKRGASEVEPESGDLEVVVLEEDATNAEVAQASAQARKKRKMGRTTGEFSEDALANVGMAMENVGTVTGVPVGAGLTAITTLAGRQRLSLRE
jgi:hypothetical protein